MQPTQGSEEAVDDTPFRHVASLYGRCFVHGRPRHAHRPGNTEQDSTTWMRSAQFTADGTTLIAHDDANELRTIILPVDLLDTVKQPHRLSYYASSGRKDSLLSLAAHPAFDIADTSTTWVARGAKDLPIQLHNALAYDYMTHSYPWVHSTTEVFQGATSLAFVHNGRYLAAGTRGRLALFDVERPGQGPVVDRAPSTHMAMSQTLSHKDRGLVLALAISQNGTLAAGTTNRNVTVFADAGMGEAISSFSLQSLHSGNAGTGVSSLAWSSCQNYLLVAERQSDVTQVFDIRSGGYSLARLTGRNALSTQHFNVTVKPGPNGDEVWAGSTDGCVRSWSGLGKFEGDQAPTSSSQVSSFPVGHVAWHPQGAVMATASGGYAAPQSRRSSDTDTTDDDDDDEDDKRQEELVTLGIWSTV